MFSTLNSLSKQTLFLLHAEALKYVFYRWHVVHDPHKQGLTDFTKLIEEAIVVIDNALYQGGA